MLKNILVISIYWIFVQIAIMLPFQKWLDISDGWGPGFVYKDLSYYFYPLIFLYIFYNLVCIIQISKNNSDLLSTKTVVWSSLFYAGIITCFQYWISTLNRNIPFPDDLNYGLVTVYNFLFFFVYCVIFFLIKNYRVSAQPSQA